MDARIASLLLQMSEIEKDTENEPSADRLGEIFGLILSDIMSFGLDGSKKMTASALGKAVGHWLYLADAADDREDDAKRGRFNPFLIMFGREGFTEKVRCSVSDAMIAILMDGERAIDLMDFTTAEFAEITKNILYLGMPAEAKKILNI